MSQDSDSDNETATPGDPSVPVTTDNPAGTPSMETNEVMELKQQLALAESKGAEHWDKLLRTTADFENFKKRAAKERSEAARYAVQPLLLSLLTVLDNFEAALAAADQSGEASMPSLKTGIQMIFQQLKSALTDWGLEEIDAQGQVFDPNLHEAVSEQISTDHPEGHVLQQLRKGYRLYDRLLRPASVIVAKAPDTAPPGQESPPATNPSTSH